MGIRNWGRAEVSKDSAGIGIISGQNFRIMVSQNFNKNSLLNCIPTYLVACHACRMIGHNIFALEHYMAMVSWLQLNLNVLNLLIRPLINVARFL